MDPVKEEKINTSGEQVEETPDLMKALDDNLEAMNMILKAKKDKLSKKDIEEMMKDKENRKLVKEYMKKSKGKDGEDEEEEEEEEEDTNKSIEELDSNAEIIDAIPVLKAFKKVQENLFEQIKEVNEKMETLQKSIDDNAELSKSFANVLASQVDLVKSINEDVEIIASQPFPRKGKISTQDIIKSGLEGEDPKKTIPLAKIKNILIKSVQEGDIEMVEVARLEQNNFNLGVLKKSTLEIIESKLK